MHVVLVSVPWSPIEMPSLALGLLKSLTLREFPGARVDVVYGNLEFVDWVTERRAFRYDDYKYYDRESCYLGHGDWVFSSALYTDPSWRVPEFVEAFAPDDVPGFDRARLATTLWLHEHAGEFIDHLAARIAADAPDVVGFTTTFQTVTASLAVARRLKELSPRTVTVFGGANCEDTQGEAMHRNFGFVDFVVRGEGELAFPDLLRSVRGEGPPIAEIGGLCWRDDSGTPVFNRPGRKPLATDAMVLPHYDEYFERFGASQARRWVEPRLVIEGARGCWWGERHHCTFCGLNGASMTFRSKRPSKFFEDIVTLAERHRVLDLLVVDNILDMAYLDSLLPRLTAAGIDLRMMYEIKANLRYDQLKVLADAGVVCVQPGVESLNTNVLKLMDKGVTGCQNVRMLRDAESLGLTVIWNYLYGFPGETDDDYLPVIEQFPRLHHLCPAGADDRLGIQRFSPYFEKPELGFADRRPARQYELCYDLPQADLFDLAYLFEAPQRGIGDDLAARLSAGLDTWRGEHWRSQLSYFADDDGITIANTRPGFDWRTVRLGTPVERSLFDLLDQPRTAAFLHREVGRRTGATVAEIDAVLERWDGLGLYFSDAGRMIHVVTQDQNQRLLRILAGRQWRAADRPPAPVAV
ncbi:radical SAM protein [Actinoplanes sp. SE50]|uniref:RiPP maturation radical SAM C-methyltransferase n=1 Tax=unclassified Actinoplanes TaxID=2626549 RepID=UPI00023EC482|nr:MULTISPECIES: RiPP maturation radical SAM C-methyltransferase [unclassified Actinoplanes]AEV84653.1 Fe-S oxidoreductase [Actinoplanes sp. SE50/110]ATO83045.1 radical SAM protein [Actinoplanes sp. SE50]SLM00453.1 RiPP maturation radical SAM protein 1 [Actinoplanes sp. SE50/110]